MAATQTSTATSLSSNSTALSEEQQRPPSQHFRICPPSQHFRIGTNGISVPIEAGWNHELQQFCFHIDDLQHILGVQVGRVRRADTGVFVSRIHYENDRREPNCYPVSTGILEVYPSVGRSAPRFTNEAYETTLLIELVNRILMLIGTASLQEQQINTSEFQGALMQHLPTVIRYQNDRGNLAAVKALDYVLYPVPRRFFVVLQERPWLRKNPCANHLRLHLVCECGMHDDASDSILKERITLSEVDSAFEHKNVDSVVGSTRTHLSHHAGYNINEPKKFCRELGSHLLPVLKFLHYSTILAGIVVPALASINVSGWFTVAQSFINYNNTSWSEPWRKTLDYVADTCDVKLHLKEDELDLTKDDVPQAIEYPEYRQYQYHMEALDPSKVYGNLVPSFCNRTGRLKYVCKRHDNDPSRTREVEGNSSDHLQALGSAVVVNRSKGEVTFTMGSDLMTKRFYLYLMATPSIQNVNVELGTNVTGGELKILTKTLKHANIDSITLTATSCNTLGHYYNHVLKLMVNHRCQSLVLNGFEKFYSQISGIKKPATTRLKSLTISCSLSESQWKKLELILKLCPALRTLTISCDYSEKLREEIHSSLSHLKRLEFTAPTHTTVVRTTRSPYEKTSVYTTELIITAPCDFKSFPKGLYSHLALLRLYWLPDPNQPLKDWLTTTLQDCPRLLTLDMKMPLKHFPDWPTLLQDEFEAVNAHHSQLDSRRMVRLQSAEEDHVVNMVITFDGYDPEFDITVEMTGTADSNLPLYTVFRSHGSHIRSLVASNIFDDALAKDLIASFQDQSSKLTLLNIDPSGLTDPQHLQDIINLSPGLNDFTLSFSTLEDATQQDRAVACFAQYGNRATGLLLRGDGQCPNWISDTIPPRSQLAAVRHIEISFDGDRRQIHDEAEINELRNFISSPESAMGTPPPSNALLSISLSNCDLTSTLWHQILFALELKVLRYLSVEDTNFGAQEMDWLIKRLPLPAVFLMQDWSPPPLRELVVKNTALVQQLQIFTQLETKLLLRAPSIRVIID
ncbi:hypothetical protein EC968_005452 [Mortierella alpina]|nr:hypothetical protein EC968_005452 [Mortierella alpina]